MEQEDYSKIYEYESMGKEYSGEKACISLTSWKARINTVAKTLYSLIKMCPDFHIVLVLSKDEFPLMEKELPDNLMLFVENKLIELLWIKPNFKSFKKVLFTMDKYKTVPVISADDDCIYTCNYAQELYDKWIESKKKLGLISFRKSKQVGCPVGCSLFHSPIIGKFYRTEFKKYKRKNLQDDAFYFLVYTKHKIPFKALHNNFPCIFHDEIKPINGVSKKK